MQTWTYSQLAFTETIPQLKATILYRILISEWHFYQKRMTSKSSDGGILMNSKKLKL